MREEEAPSPAVEPTEDAAAPPTKRGRHRVLACATLASIINAFMFMNFSPIVELSRRRFRVSEGQVIAFTSRCAWPDIVLGVTDFQESELSSVSELFMTI